MALIEKGAAPPPSFEEQMRAAEQEAGMPSDAEMYGQIYDTPDPDETGRIPSPSPPRDEQGRFITEEAPVEAEAEPEAEPEPVVEAEPEPEDPTATQLADLNKKLGQLINENAELRRAQEQQPQYQQPAQPPLTQMDGFDEWAEVNPVQAVQWAAQNQQPHLYDRAIRSWYEQDPVGASRYERQLESAALVQNLQQQIQPQLATAEKLSTEQGISQAINSVAARHPDFGDVVGVLDEAAVKTIMESGLPAGVLANALQGSAAEKEQAIETVYRWVKADRADTFQSAAAEQAKRSSDEAREAKLEAYVGSATTTTPDVVPESEADRQWRVWQETTPTLRTGWTGKESRNPSRLGR